MDEITFLAIIWRIKVIAIMVGADFCAEAETELNTANAYFDGNCGGI